MVDVFYRASASPHTPIDSIYSDDPSDWKYANPSPVGPGLRNEFMDILAAWFFSQKRLNVFFTTKLGPCEIKTDDCNQWIFPHLVVSAGRESCTINFLASSTDEQWHSSWKEFRSSFIT